MRLVKLSQVWEEQAWPIYVNPDRVWHIADNGKGKTSITFGGKQGDEAEFVNVQGNVDEVAHRLTDEERQVKAMEEIASHLAYITTHIDRVETLEGRIADSLASLAKVADTWYILHG